ncbi:DUF2970 domain-containing protein [Sediminicurvatus halobius]|uniref:DUF2970 domain-containing protein n=1 Tax=Sediminicurvatus halobius TaxID=2182432 RepID=A0A2U2MW68_9GAMM|nr:DUF2970 domain-containing protein [Spiribacter halobius]PWG61111.1 hypothetical protein DEM34_18110 [Spiribacter halobius]UEX77081.1 DUF2970 domain-containing protein [Spiribacter halobius]
MSDHGEERHEAEQPRRLTVWQVAKSTLAAAFGVQTEEARRRDFTQGSPAPFIIAGLVFTVLFVIALVVIVNIVLSTAA